MKRIYGERVSDAQERRKNNQEQTYEQTNKRKDSAIA